MRTTHTFGLQFIIRSNKNDQNSGIIYVRITIEGQRVEISLKKTLPISLWNNARGKVNGSSKDAKSLNTYLDDIQI